MAELQLAKRFDMLEGCDTAIGPAVGSGDFSFWVADVRVGVKRCGAFAAGLAQKSALARKPT
jgi:hypothetical protein